MVANNRETAGSGLTDSQLLKKARNAANGRRFELRFESDYDDPELRRRYGSRRQALGAVDAPTVTHDTVRGYQTDGIVGVSD